MQTFALVVAVISTVPCRLVTKLVRAGAHPIASGGLWLVSRD